jgi:hypothetical protein
VMRTPAHGYEPTRGCDGRRRRARQPYKIFSMPVVVELG